MTTTDAIREIRTEASDLESRGFPHYKALSVATDYFVLRHSPDLDVLRDIETMLYEDES